MDAYHLPSSPHQDSIVFGGNSATAGGGWYTWTKPIGKAYVSIVMIGAGGGGGSGAIGANSTAAGGGGGGSGALTLLDIPLSILPNRLYISVGQSKTGAGVASYVSTQPNTTANHVIGIANAGGAGGNASGATVGAAGAAGAIATVATMPLGWAFSKTNMAGQAGIAGGVAGVGNLTLPVTGIRMTGGGGGAGVPATGVSGAAGGGFSTPSTTNAPYFPQQLGGASTTVATNPANPGNSGFETGGAMGGYFFYGGTGGSATHGSATGTGLVQGRGGNGGTGSGGGGSGGALTGSTAAPLSYGGGGLVIMTCY